MTSRHDSGASPAGVGTRIAQRLVAVALLASVGSCAPVMRTPEVLPVPEIARDARVVRASPRLECVTFARQQSGITIRGDAWTWWDRARARYRQGAQPEPGAVMVFRRKGGSSGHLAVVTRVAGNRLIVVDHANWLNDGHVHKATPVMDVSERGDWSAVRVWHTPGRHWGTGTYGVYGFVYPEGYAVGAGANTVARE